MRDNLRSDTPPNIISRFRSRTPVSHVAEHADQSDHSITAQGLVAMQACVLHATVSVKVLRFAQVPPRSGCDWSCRFLYVWPPPQDLSQSAQTDQSEISQSLGSAAWHPAVCFMASLQALPAPRAGVSTSRVRYFCWGLAKLQPIQSVHWPRPQSCDSLTQRPSLHGIAFRMMPEQGCPPNCAGRDTRRSAALYPSHDALHSVHCPHSENSQSTGRSVSHGAVSLRFPPQGLPSPIGGAKSWRLRYLWSTEESHCVQSDHPERAQSWLSAEHSGLGQLFDSIFGPTQGLPHSLFTLSMLRWRKHRPLQPPASYQLAQEPNWQFTGWHAAPHAGSPSHLA